MSIFRRSLSHKVILWISAILCFSCFLGFLGANQYYHHTLKPKNDAKTTAIAKSIQQFYQQLPEKKRAPYLKSVTKTGYDLALFTNGTVQYYGTHFRITHLTPSAKTVVKQEGIYHGIRHYRKGPFITGFFADDINNTIGIRLNAQQQLFIRANPMAQFGELRAYMLAIGLIAILLGTSLLVFTAQRHLVRPLQFLTRATQKVASGDYAVTLNVKGQDEISQLTQSFQTMTQKLATVEKSRNEFVANVSHDLQSPLTALKGYAEALEDPELSPKQKKHYLEIIKTETNRLSQLTKELLLLSALDQEQTLDFQQDIALDQQLKASIQAFSFQLDEKELFVDTTLPSVHIVGNPDLLFQVWQNLLTNSIRYAPEASDLQLTLQPLEKQAIICFTNFGPVLSEEDQTRIFERFYQSDLSRKAQNHRGLGLAIAAKIIQLHHGTLQVTSTPKTGTTFKVTLPINL